MSIFNNISNKNLLRIFLIFTLLIIKSTVAYASTGGISPTSTGYKKQTPKISEITKGSEVKLLMNIVSANENGSSYNKFNKFQQENKPLLLVNNPYLNKNLSSNPANVIVVHNQSLLPLYIREVEVLGKRADLVILSPSGVICDSCKFKNTNRVLLSTGEPTLNSDFDLSAVDVKQGTLSITAEGLKTYDASIVELLAEHVNFDGPIDTMTRASKKGKEYDFSSSHGNLRVSQGDLQVIIGKNKMDYETSHAFVTDIDANRDLIRVKYPIRSGNVTIQSTTKDKNVSIDSNIDTKGDIYFSGTYKGNNLIPKDSITIKSFSGLNIENVQLTSGNSIKMEAKDISIYPDNTFKKYSAKSDRINIVAEGKIINKGLLLATDIKVAAAAVDNNGGELWAHSNIYVSGLNYISNDNQGLIIGNDIALETEGIIKNGMQHPWACVSAGNMQFRISHVEIGSGAGIIKHPLRKCTRERYWTELERKANIIGFNVAITGRKVWNSNPYIKERINFYSPEINMSITSSYDTSISAENLLVVKAKEEFTNGSGVIEVLNGNMSIETPIIRNQRYYIEAKTHVEKKNANSEVQRKCNRVIFEKLRWKAVNMGYSNPNDFPEIQKLKRECLKYSNVSKEIITTTQYVSALSPVGRMLTVGNLMVNGSKIYNEASTIEVQGSIIGSLNKIESKGLELKEEVVKRTTIFHQRRYCSRRVVGMCVKRKVERWTTTSEELIQDAVKAQFPALIEINRANIKVADGKIVAGNISF